MGHIRRLVGYSLAVLGIGLSLFLPWWEGGGDLGDLTVTLLKVKLCMKGSGCASVDAGGAYGIIAAATAAYGGVACVALILGGILPALGGSTPKVWPPFASIVYLFWVMIASASLNPPDEVQAMFPLHHTLWFYCGVAGAIIGLLTPIVAAFGAPKNVPFVPMTLPPKPGAHKPEPETGPNPYPGGPFKPLPVVRRGPEAIDLDLPPVAITISPEPVASALDLLPPPETIEVPEEIAVSASEIVMPPEEEVSPRGGLRFALVTANVREGGVEVRGADGRARSVPWSDVAGALARELRDAPPFPDSMFVDLVMREGPPLRLTLATAITFAAGEPPAGVRDALRRVIALARAKCEHLELEPATADFVTRREPLPVWTLRELAAYDARYKA
jgi:hypothetical protein